jgi:hypothetical protein
LTKIAYSKDKEGAGSHGCDRMVVGFIITCAISDYFEIPHPEGKPIFVGREWLFNDMEMVCIILEEMNLLINS